jgi:hypothetical protein
MAGYIGTKAVNLSTTGADIAGDADVSGALDVGGAFTSQGIDDNATSTAMTLDGSGNLLVGTTNTDPANSNVNGTAIGAANYFSMTRTNGASMILNRKSSDGDIALFRKDGTTVGVIGVNSSDLMIGTGDTGMRFSDGEDSFVPSTITGNANRDNAIDLGKTSSRFKDLYLSGGVYLGGTGSANYLDDYEEGTWTPTVSSGTITVNSNGGTYTKIGRVVHCAVVFHDVSDTSSGSAFGISGLPFDADPNGNAWGSSMWKKNGSGKHICYITDSNQVRFYHGSTSGAYSSLTHSQLTSGAGAHIFFTYTTSS